MKTTFKLTVLLFFSILLYNIAMMKKSNFTMHDAYSQIEALANGEEGNTNECIGIGSIHCAGIKVSYSGVSR